jgi:hypothetical protein
MRKEASRGIGFAAAAFMAVAGTGGAFAQTVDVCSAAVTGDSAKTAMGDLRAAYKTARPKIDCLLSRWHQYPLCPSALTDVSKSLDDDLETIAKILNEYGLADKAISRKSQKDLEAVTGCADSIRGRAAKAEEAFRLNPK